MEVPVKPLHTLITKPTWNQLMPYPGNLPGRKENSIARRHVMTALEALGESPFVVDDAHPLVVVDTQSSSFNYAVGYSPCLTVSRVSTGGHWLVQYQRYTTLLECMKLSGIPVHKLEGWMRAVTSHDMKVLVGNCIPPPLFARVVYCALVATSLVSRPLKDPIA